eukprot:11593369-Karenia_brevis.AAC.1
MNFHPTGKRRAHGKKPPVATSDPYTHHAQHPLAPHQEIPKGDDPSSSSVNPSGEESKGAG